MAAVLQDQLGDIACRRGGVDPPAKAVAHELGQIAGVVEMSMCQNYSVDTGRGDWKRLPVEFAQILEALEQAAIDQDALVVVGEEVF